MTAPRIAVTAGDPAGIGPELLVRLLHETRAESERIVVISHVEELQAGLDRSHLGVTVEELLAPESIQLISLDAPWPGVVGEVSASAGSWALAALEKAVELHLRGAVDGLWFAPLNKAALHAAGMSEPDEMRWFESRIPGAATCSEVNVSDAFWTSRVTSHVPLRDVADLITPDSVAAATRLLAGLLRRAGAHHPRLAVCALNPHAGEGGLFGNEEMTAISPGVVISQKEGIDVAGPFPCDTLFRKGFNGTYDGIVTMYHDQGQIALKTGSFEGGVTLEAGLPLPICTPAHGSAFDIVGTGTASLVSSLNAYQLVRKLAVARV